jgi:hypothetical protein
VKELGTLLEMYISSRVPVAHACNPTYSGGRDQEDRGLSPAPVKSSWDPIWKKTITKKGWWSGSRCRPWVQTKKEKKCASPGPFCGLVNRNLCGWVQQLVVMVSRWVMHREVCWGPVLLSLERWRLPEEERCWRASLRESTFSPVLGNHDHVKGPGERAQMDKQTHCRASRKSSLRPLLETK